jgi:hypothetical protein
MADQDEAQNHITKTVDSQLRPDAALEAEAQKLHALPLHPLITRIHQKMGALNLIRNARNERQAAIDEAEQAG